jgi:hypothetical protein
MVSPDSQDFNYSERSTEKKKSYENNEAILNNSTENTDISISNFSCQGNTAEKRNHEPLDEEEKRSEKLSNPENKLETSKIFKSTVLDDENEKVTNEKQSLFSAAANKAKESGLVEKGGFSGGLFCKDSENLISSCSNIFKSPNSRSIFSESANLLSADNKSLTKSEELIDFEKYSEANSKASKDTEPTSFLYDHVLKDVCKQEMKTGEEDEESLLSCSCKLFRLKDDQSWACLGDCIIKVNRTKALPFRSRIVCRSKNVKKLLLNANICAGMGVRKANLRNIVLTLFESTIEPGATVRYRLQTYLVRANAQDTEKFYDTIITLISDKKEKEKEENNKHENFEQ